MYLCILLTSILKTPFNETKDLVRMSMCIFNVRTTSCDLFGILCKNGSIQNENDLLKAVSSNLALHIVILSEFYKNKSLQNWLEFDSWSAISEYTVYNSTIYEIT